MIGAFGMHLKIKDPFRKSIPALIMLAFAWRFYYLQLNAALQNLSDPFLQLIKRSKLSD